MAGILNFILWDVSPEIFSVGPLTVRWYGLLFALGFLIGQQILIRIYKQEGKSEKHVETLTIYMVVATVIGARLGHCLFYQPDYYLVHPLEILKIWEGGLASHGATIGILIAIYLYSKKTTGQSYFYVLDRLVITIALAGCLIRLGNLMNSEIVGKPSDSPVSFLFVHEAKAGYQEWNQNYVEGIELKKNGEKMNTFNAEINKDLQVEGLDFKIRFRKNKIEQKDIPLFINETLNSDTMRKILSSQNLIIPFKEINPQVTEAGNGSYDATIKVFAIPRLPSQLFEAISSFLLFVMLWFIYDRKREKTPEGRIFGLFVVILFSLRFLYEFQKENQVEFEDSMVQNFGINIGQLLSIPLVLAGLFILIRTYRKKGEIS